MSIAIVRGWEWLEAELHKALALVHHTHVPSEVPAAAKAAVSAVIDAAKADALATAAQLGGAAAAAAVAEGVNGVASRLGQPVGDLLDGLKGLEGAETVGDLENGAAGEKE